MKTSELARMRFTTIPTAVTFAAYGLHFKLTGPKGAVDCAEDYICELRPEALATLHSALTKAKTTPMLDREIAMLRRSSMVLVRLGCKLEAVQ